MKIIRIYISEITYQNMWDAADGVLKGKYFA